MPNFISPNFISNFKVQYSGSYYYFRITQDIFISHLSWRLKWAFLIKICPLSVDVVVVVVVVVIVVVKTFHIFIFSSRTTGSISTKLGTKHPWVKRIKVSSNEGPHHFQRGDNYEIAKIYQWYLKSSPEPLEPISTKL